MIEIPTSMVFLDADAQLLGTSLVDPRMPLTVCLKSHLELNKHGSASPHSMSC